MEMVPGATLVQSNSKLQVQKTEAGGMWSCQRVDRHQHKESENNMFWESLELD